MPNSSAQTGWKTKVSELLGTDYPVVLGPMRKITMGKMAGAVSAAGGLGVIGASGASAQTLEKEIAIAREITDKPIGVNIPIYRQNAFEALEVAVQTGVKVIYTSAGNPAKMVDQIKKAGLVMIHKVSGEKTAKKAQDAGVDAVVAMGYEAGGHIGRDNITTMCLVPRLADILDIPVIASGGIGDARAVAAAFALGAEGVEIGTRFVATEECPVPDFFKEKVKHAESGATLLLGKEAMPIRVLKNPVTMKVAGMVDDKADEAIETHGDAVYITEGGDENSAVMPCGQVAGVVKTISRIQDVFDEIQQEITPVLDRLNRIIGRQ